MKGIILCSDSTSLRIIGEWFDFCFMRIVESQFLSLFTERKIIFQSFLIYDFDYGHEHNQRRRKKLLRRWSHPKFSSRSQAKLESLENNQFEEDTKRKIIFDTIYHENPSNYSSFIVCRNPVGKLLSVYKYLLDMFQRKATLSKSYEKSRLSYLLSDEVENIYF